MVANVARSCRRLRRAEVPAMRVVLLWHPDSPGMRVPVRLTWWRWRPSGFATLGDTLRYYKARELVRHE